MRSDEPWLVLAITAIGAPILGMLMHFFVPIVKWLRKPGWFFRDIVVAALLAGAVFWSQKVVDDHRAERDHAIAAQLDATAKRLENLRFVRERSSAQYQARPFRSLDLVGMNLSGLFLASADFTRADLRGAELRLTDLRSCSVIPDPRTDYCAVSAEAGSEKPWPVALMAGVNLCNAVLTGARLNGAVLIKANIANADLTMTDLRDAILYGADLRNSKLPLNSELLHNVHYNSETRWPQQENFEPPPKDPREEFFAEGMSGIIDYWLMGDMKAPSCDA